MDANDDALFGVGVLADSLGVSRSTIRSWERLGRIPPPTRLLGSERRVYRPEDLALIRERMTEMRAAGRRQSDPGRAA